MAKDVFVEGYKIADTMEWIGVGPAGVFGTNNMRIFNFSYLNPQIGLCVESPLVTFNVI